MSSEYGNAYICTRADKNALDMNIHDHMQDTSSRQAQPRMCEAIDYVCQSFCSSSGKITQTGNYGQGLQEEEDTNVTLGTMYI